MMLSEKYKEEITIEELSDLHKTEYVLVDTRDDISYEYGHIPGSINMENILDKAKDGTLDITKSYILYCMHGKLSLNLCEQLKEYGYDVLSLKDGYASWLKASLGRFDPDIRKKAERSIIKTYHKELLSPFLKAFDRYQLLSNGDRIAICISGGKDSMLMAKLFQEIYPYSKIKFEPVFLVMDPGYSELNRMMIEDNARKLGVPIQIFESRIFDIVDNTEKSPCYLCARMRRGHLYAKAKELGCNKIALGHHFDDAIETTLMGMMYAGQIQTMMPKLKSENFEDMELIRPMYLIREKDIINWRDYNGLHFIQCACHFTDTCSSCRDDGSSISKRMETKKLIESLKKNNPYIENNIFKAMENVCLDQVIAYKKNDIKHSFLDDYNEKESH